MAKRSEAHDISQITNYLYISEWPEGEHADQLQALGIRLILSMHWQKPQKALWQPPLRLLWLPTIDFPLTPIPMRTLLRGVGAALPVIREGGAVLSHCKYGVHRSVAMACCVLIGMGYSAEAAMRLVKQRRPAADPYAGYVKARILKFERRWRELQSRSGVEA